VTILVLLAAFATSGGSEGDLMLRLWRRFPQCEGVSSGAFAGDEFASLFRSRIRLGSLRTVLITEKDRGEHWGDLLAAGASYEGGPVLESASAGWLRAGLGSGMVFGETASWGAGAPGLDARPPGRDSRVSPATGASSCEGEPLTGVSASLRLGLLSLTGMQSWSSLDASSDGLHRTPSEISSRGSVHEVVSAARACLGPGGMTFMRRTAAGDLCFRAGADFGIPASGCLLSGEGAVECDSTTSAAFWLAMSEDGERLRFCAAAFRMPEGFGEDRSSTPMGMECDLGCGFAVRSRFSDGWLGAMSVSAGSLEGSGRERYSFEISRWLCPGLEAIAGARAYLGTGESTWRESARISWRASQDASAGIEIQLTSASGGEGREAGGALEGKIRWTPAGMLSISAGFAGFSTAGYASRVYCGELGFPGEFGSTAVSGDGFLLQGSVSFSLAGGTRIRGRVSRLIREDVETMGSGLEETPGGNRTEVGVQMEMPLGTRPSEL
jgi:hypothetical protein